MNKNGWYSFNDFSELKVGSLISQKTSKDAVYVITAVYGDRATAVRTVDITNPQEWEIRKKDYPYDY